LKIRLMVVVQRFDDQSPIAQPLKAAVKLSRGAAHARQAFQNWGRLRFVDNPFGIGATGKDIGSYL
jgi:hypothetical protein